MKHVKKPLAKIHWKRGRTGRVVCFCGKGYGSEYEGLCFSCRGCTSFEAKLKEKNT